MTEFLQIGVVTSAHGLKGEVKIFPTTDDANRFKKLKEIYMDLGNGNIPLTVESVKYSKGRPILKFKTYDRIEDIEKMVGKSLLIPRSKAIPLKKDEFFVGDLLDSDILLEDGSFFGKLKDILKTGANDVYVIESADGQEVLLPSVKDFILNVDLKKHAITVRMLPEI